MLRFIIAYSFPANIVTGTINRAPGKRYRKIA
jgi:hypothetical protein